MDLEKARRAVHYLFTVVTLVFFVSGLGITEFRIIEPLSGGLLTKSLSFQIHNMLTWPFIVLLGLHICLVMAIRKGKEKKNRH